MVWWVVDLRMSPFRLAVLGTALVLSILVTETPTGVVADLYSRKYSVVAAYVVMGSAMALGPVTELFGVLVVWQVLWGVGWTLQSGAATAWMTDEIAHHASHSHRSAAVMPVEPHTAADPRAGDGSAGDSGAGDSGATDGNGGADGGSAGGGADGADGGGVGGAKRVVARIIIVQGLTAAGLAARPAAIRAARWTGSSCDMPSSGRWASWSAWSPPLRWVRGRSGGRWR